MAPLFAALSPETSSPLSFSSLASRLPPDLQLILRNAAQLVFSGLTIQALSLLSSMLLAHHLQATGYGQYAFGQTSAWFMGMLIVFGTRNVIIREVPRQPGAAGTYLVQTVLLRCAISLVVLPLALALGLSHEPSAALHPVLITYGLIAFFDYVYQTFQTVFRGLETMRYESRILVVERIFIVAGFAFAASHNWALLGFVQLILAASMLRGLLFVAVAARFIPAAPVRFDPGLLRHILHEAVPFAMTDLVVALALRIDLLILSTLVPFSEVGVYFASYAVIGAVLSLPNMLYTALQPTAVRLYRQDATALHQTNRVLLYWIALLVAPVIALVAGGAPVILGSLFGRTFTQSANILRILAVSLPFSVLNGMTSTLMISGDQQRRLFRVTAAGAAVNIAANLLLVPHYGAYGAAQATVISEAVLAGCLYYFNRQRWSRRDLRRILAPLALASLVSVCVWQIQKHIGWLGLAIGLTLYLAVIAVIIRRGLLGWSLEAATSRGTAVLAVDPVPTND